jgi:hypothetical protein
MPLFRAQVQYWKSEQDYQQQRRGALDDPVDLRGCVTRSNLLLVSRPCIRGGASLSTPCRIAASCAGCRFRYEVLVDMADPKWGFTLQPTSASDTRRTWHLRAPTESGRLEWSRRLVLACLVSGS